MPSTRGMGVRIKPEEMENNPDINKLKELLSGRSIVENIELLSGIFRGKIIFTTSFGIEDQVITHKIFTNNLPVKVVTFDTGRLFPETFDVFSQTTVRYAKKISVYFPDTKQLEKMIEEKGPFSFYKSLENRLECCNIRKVSSLNRALEGMKCWISGIRAAQSDNRNSMEMIEYDQSRELFKFHPLFKWSFDDVMNFITENNVPYNTLHDKGYISIGCEPCTRAVKPGGDFRSGRWWWENASAKECGCHHINPGI